MNPRWQLWCTSQTQALKIEVKDSEPPSPRAHTMHPCTRIIHGRKGNQLKRGRRCSALFTIELKALLSFHDWLWLGWEIRGNTDSPAILWTHYLLYTMENTSSNQRGAVGLLIDVLCLRGEAERGEGRGKRERVCHRCPALWKKIKQVPH